jgi:SAM-dependent methyltransferase
VKKLTRRSMEAFLTRHATAEPILEIGGGRVSTNHNYSHLFPNRHMVDIDPNRQPDTLGDAHALPFPDSSFDRILCTEVLEHCHTPQLAVSEMHRVLSPGGKLVLTTRFVFPIHDAPHDFYRYTKYGMQHLFRDWEIIELVPESGAFTALGTLFQRISLQTQLRGGRITRILLRALAQVLARLDGLVKHEYGDVSWSRTEDHFMSTGYYIVARKRT